MSIIYEKLGYMISMFNGAKTTDFHLWSLPVQTLLQERDLDEALEGKDVNGTSPKKALTVIVTSLGDN